MFCLMDVSGSMSESMKDLAKRFFLLLHVFLGRRYKRVDLVFIRHTEVAEEVEEEVFFTDPRTGGTIVSTALAELTRIQRERYPPAPGTSTRRRPRTATTPAATRTAQWPCWRRTSCPWCSISPISRCRSRRRSSAGETDLWRGYAPLAERAPKLAMRRVAERRDIFPVFRELFGRKAAAG